MAKWKRSGVARLSSSKKVVNIGIYEQKDTKWLIVDVALLFDLIEGRAQEIPIMEVDNSS